MKQHARFAASSSERWLNCPASIKLSEIAPPQKSGAAADEGTLAHSLMEFALETNVKDVVKFFENDEKYPTEMKRHVQSFVNFVRSQMQPHFELLVEEKVQLPFLHPDQAFGTVDVAIVEPFGVLHVIDFKYGLGYVDHKDNAQMSFYALGIAHKHCFDFEEIKTTIFQPRIDMDPARTHSFSVAKLREWQERFKAAIDAAESADPKKDVCEGSWCKFCPAKVICPALSERLLATAKLDFAAPAIPQPKELTPDQLRTVLDRAHLLELWIKSVKKYAEEQLRAGKKIDGWELAPKRAVKKWVDVDKVKSSRYSKHLVEECLVSPAQAEKLLKGEDKDEVKSFLKENVVAVSSGDKLNKTETNNDFELDIEVD